MFNFFTNNKPNKAVNDLLDPDKLYFESVQKGSLKKPKNDIIERQDNKLLTNDGRELLNENPNGN